MESNGVYLCILIHGTVNMDFIAMAFCGILLEYDKILMISLTNWMASFCHMHHPPVITSFIGGMVTIPKWEHYTVLPRSV